MVFDKPGYQITVHINIYLSTAGKEKEFVQELALLEETIENAIETYPDCTIYIRGDANASVVPRNKNKRDLLFQHFIANNSLVPLPIDHHTYHHFINDGLSDSSIDVVLGSMHTSEGFPNPIQESFLKIICGKTNPTVDSSHDAIFTSLSLPPIPSSLTDSSENVKAPRVLSTKHKVLWSDEGKEEYKQLLSHTLPALQELDYDDLLPGAASLLFHTTNHILTTAACQTNKVLDLSKPPENNNTPRLPATVSAAMKSKAVAHKKLLSVSCNPNATKSEIIEAKANFKKVKALHQNVVRNHINNQDCERDDKFLEILSKDPRSVFRRLKSKRSKDSSKIDKLHVAEKVYTNENVADGFFDAVSSLKTLKQITSSSFEQFSEDHKNILEICKSAKKIPRISLTDAESLLRKLKPNVSDYFSVTAAHYLNGGDAGIQHFHFLFNTILQNIEITAAEEMNRAHAIILHKSHNKPKNLSSSYRTISSCPFLAKAVDMYLGMLSKSDWSGHQAHTQYLWDGMSHEMAGLLLTSTIHNSLQENKPIFVLLLDARSAFDLVLREILVRRLYLDTEPDQRIKYWDTRLSKRTTYCQWEDQQMGPINDQCGVEQGGPNSSEFYKIYNNEQITSAQESGFGTTIGKIHIAAIGLADDTALVSHDISQLQHLLQLTLNYCHKYQVELSTSKTKLLTFSPTESQYVKYTKLLSPIHISNNVIPSVTTAEHVGILRSVTGNLPHIQQRLSSHRKALGAILFSGMARRHRANPLASLRADKIFGIPVLYSGLASLILNKQETDIINQHVKETVQNLLKLHQKTPEPFIFFIAGSLPGEALLHLKQLTLFGAICRLPENILNTIARNVLTSSPEKDTSWFAHIRALCFRYALPHPLTLLSNPQSKENFKNLVKLNIVQYWQEHLTSKVRNNEKEMSSLKYFKPQFMSLLRPHPILTTAGNSYDTNKIIIQLRMLSGRYRVGSLLKHFSPTNSGICELCNLEEETLSHLLLPRCPLLSERRELLITHSRNILKPSPISTEIFEQILADNNYELFMQFILDCSTIPSIIRASQQDSSVLPLFFKICRTWCYSLHRTRLKLLGRWN